MKQKVSEKIEQISNGILAMAGIFASPSKNAKPVGNSKSGAPVFVSPEIAGSADTRSGAALLHMLAMFVQPFHVLNKKEKEGMQKLIKTSSDSKLFAVLDREHMNRNGESFAATLIKAIGAPTSHMLAVVTALKIYDHWGVISPAQKSLAIAAMGVQLHKTDKGGAIYDLKIVDGPDQVFLVKDALDMVMQNKNPYPLVRYWDQIYNLARVYNSKPNTTVLEDFAASHGLLGAGANDSAVPGVTKEDIKASGGRPAPQYGVGAVVAPSNSSTPNGYAKVLSSQKGDIFVPQANMKSAIGALQDSPVGTSAGKDGSSSDAASVYGRWDKKEAKQKDKGADGGSAFIAGLTNLKKPYPQLYSALIAFLTRYCDDPILSSTAEKYFASLAGIALARIVAGKAEAKADNEGAKLARALKGADTPGAYAKLQIDIRALYANFGVSSRADAYQLSNQAYSEDRINESDLVAMHEIYDLIYEDDTLEAARKLLNGKDKGLEIARDKTPRASNTMVDGQISDHKETMKQLTKEELRARNAAKYAAKKPVQEGAETASQAQPTQNLATPKSAPQPKEAPTLPSNTTPSDEMGATP